MQPQDLSVEQKQQLYKTLSFVYQVLTERVQFFHEEFENAHSAVNFVQNLASQIQNQIETTPSTNSSEVKADEQA